MVSDLFQSRASFGPFVFCHSLSGFKTGNFHHFSEQILDGFSTFEMVRKIRAVVPQNLAAQRLRLPLRAP